MADRWDLRVMSFEFQWIIRIEGAAMDFRLKVILCMGAVFMVAGSHCLAQSNPQPPSGQSTITPDASGYAQRIASMISNRPECRKFKDEILSYSKGSPYDGKTVGPIVKAKQDANAAGCSSPSATGAGIHGAASTLGQAGAAAQGDAHEYNRKMAVLISDRPECKKYKDAILAQAGGQHPHWCDYWTYCPSQTRSK